MNANLRQVGSPTVSIDGSAALPGAVRRRDRSQATRRALAFVGVSPILGLLGTRLLGVVHDPLLGLYSMLVLTMLATLLYLAFGEYRDPSFDAAVVDERPFVSCLVAVKNEAQLIRRCVDSIRGCNYRNLELIVVDDGSTDGTTEQLEAIAKVDPRIEVVRLEHSVGKKRALTIGAERARGGIFVFTDSDCVLAADAIDRLVAAFAAHPEIGALAGHARALNATENFLTKAQDTWYEGQFSVVKAAESVCGSVTCISGPLAAFRREAIYNLLPAWANDRFLGKEFRFATDRQLTAYVLGSTVVAERLKRPYADSPFIAGCDYPARKWRIGYVKSARAWTAVPRSLPKLVRQQVRWKKSFIRNLFFTGSFYWRRGPVPAFLFYGRSLLVAATPVMAARHLVYMPMRGAYDLSALYIVGIFLKGSIWAIAYKIENPGCPRWVYRPAMSLMIVFLFSPLLLYSIATLRRNVWARG
jgi:cellulose synthase/poly-beta-1,6-N-acetylglucosamine synthase-like glycosyltransferase